MYHTRLYIAFTFILLSFHLLYVSAVGTGVCTGYPLMYNGKHCASTTRYWDGNMGACGCGTGDTSPFSWQYTMYTAAGSPPIFGSGTWCGSGCGKCYELTPTAVGASPIPSRGAPSLNSIVIKVTNLCPPAGNDNWCSYDINSYGYDAHFDLMDYQMNGLITALGWDNPEVTYQEVDCTSYNRTEWNCQCASASSAPAAINTPTPTSAPTTAPSAPTSAPTNRPTSAPTTSPTTAHTSSPTSVPSTNTIQVQVNAGTNMWWLGVTFVNAGQLSKVEVKDSGTATASTFQTMQYSGNAYWNMYSFQNSKQLTAPFSLRLTSSSGKVVVLNNVIGDFRAVTIDSKVSM